MIRGLREGSAAIWVGGLFLSVRFGKGVKTKAEAYPVSIQLNWNKLPGRRKKHMAKKRPPMHPGEVLREEFLVPLCLSAGAMAKACGVPRARIGRIASEKAPMTADTALRLGKALGTSAQPWLNLQNEFDMRTATIRIGKELEKISSVATRTL